MMILDRSTNRDITKDHNARFDGSYLSERPAGHGPTAARD